MLPRVVTAALAVSLALQGTPSVQAQTPGRLLVVNKAEASLSVVDLAQRGEIARIPTGDSPHEVAVSPDGQIAVVTNYGTRAEPGNTLTVVDLGTLQPVATIDLGEQLRPHGITWLPGTGRVAVTTEGSGTLTIVDVESRSVVAAIPTGQRTSHQVSVTPDGRRAFVANIGSGSVTVINLETLATLRSISTGSGAEGVAVSPNGKEVWVTNRAENTVTILDAGTLETLTTLPSAEFPIRVVFTPGGDRALVTNARSAQLRVFDVESRREVKTIPIEAPVIEGRDQVISFEGSPSPIGLLADPDGRHAYVATASGDAVAVVDLEAGAVVDLIPVGKEPDGLALAPGGIR
jgi:YVTN family beta-propeller protein